ncbi:GDSL-type esterase/lipase family protein [Clostridium folliculivorans]|uniref:Lipase/acylhydrolase n=1 Tax=Clostridium folliculivorans TaxID=2886038 RepID=A0A9W5XYD7_9CLOT|nr:GDSL-type esterase/lipase family protein [Clostridium folliculivorans]GKU23186.1 lipase/acylhydrolase [Clostridium folliculivorans]GKU29232.1 lipase/acylhydrolase [Clostridium folliculivorans]
MKIVCIGDSLTYGYGVSPSKGWVNLLRASTKYDIVNKGVNGDTTVGILSRFSRDCIDLKPNIAVIMAGTNDLLTGRSIDNIVDNIIYMVNDCVNSNVKPVVLIPPLTLPRLAEVSWYSSIDYNYVNDMINIMEGLFENNIKDTLIISLNKLIPLYEEYYIDGIHLTALGNEIIFNKLSSDFEDQIKKLS